MTLGPYVMPALASFRPPAALVGSAALSFFQFESQPLACDGPACSMSAKSLYSLVSSGFNGEVRILVKPTSPTSGWNLSAQPSQFKIKPGNETTVGVRADCYHNPQVGASPSNLNVEVTAIAYPADGSPSWVAGSAMMTAQVVSSSLSFLPGPPAPPALGGGTASTFINLVAAWVDTSAYGPVRLSASNITKGWTVRFDKSAVQFNLNGQAAVAITIQKRAADAANTCTFQIHATLDHASFSVPLKASMPMQVVSGP